MLGVFNLSLFSASLGYLKKHHMKLFSPPLPSKNIAAIESIDFGTIDKIVLEFDHPFWNHDNPGLYFHKLSTRGFKQSFQPGINVTKALTPALFYWHENTKKMFVVLNTTFWQQLLSNMLPFYAFLMLILAFLKPNLNYKIEHWKHHIFFGILKYNFWRLGFMKLTLGVPWRSCRDPRDF